MIKKHKKNIIISIIIIFFIVFCYYQNNIIVISQYTYSSPSITKDLDDFTIVQISDLHGKRFGKNQKKLIKKIEKCNPDMIVITGDLVDERTKNYRNIKSFIEKATKIAPVYYVTGNHEKWLSEAKEKELFDILNENGVFVLDNEYIKVNAGKSAFTLAGLDDGSLYDDTIKTLDLKNKPKPVVLLAHEPQLIEQYSLYGAELVLSGHAHGGQFRFPIIGGVYAPDQGFNPKYTSGTHKENDTTMIISRGLGNSVIPLRLFNLPEIVVVNFKMQ